MVEKGKMPPSAHDFALKDLEFSSSNAFFLVKNPPVENSASPESQSSYMFYPGCQLSASSPEHVENTYKFLLSNNLNAGLMLGCCGAPADWAGRADLAKENGEKIKAAWLEADQPTFILACTSCAAVFERYLPEIKTVSLYDILADFDFHKTPTNPKTLHIHDACGARDKADIQDSVRKLAQSLGYTIEESEYTREKTKCCGYGGLVFYANRDQEKLFAADIINESPNDLLVYCAMCKDLFIDQGKRTFHILDLLFADDPENYAEKPMPSLSKRRENRANLKRNLLRDIWQEDAEAPPESLNLIIPPDIRALMEERYILLEDITDVLEHSRHTGDYFLNPADGSSLASLRKKNVTYWVQWREDENINILKVYSHRMDVFR
jgi:hypothetical protein